MFANQKWRVLRLDRCGYCTYNNPMQYEWDERKNEQNIAKHGFDFASVELFEWEHAVIYEDVRRQYLETRFIAYSYIQARLVVLVYTMRSDCVRVISLRKANTREVKQHGN